MIESWLFALAIGAIVGFAMSTVATRKKKAYLIYMLAGMVGATAYVAYPLALGNGYINTSLKFTVAVSGLVTGLAILFVRVK